MKLSIIYHSESGNTAEVADIIAEGARNAGHVEVRCMNIGDIDVDFVKQSSALIFGTPTYLATFSWQMKKFIDTELKSLDVEGKLCGVFATENYLGGGADVAELSLIGQLLVRGVLAYSVGASKGQPYTHLGVVTRKMGDDFEKERAMLFGKRFTEKALELFG